MQPRCRPRLLARALNRFTMKWSNYVSAILARISRIRRDRAVRQARARHSCRSSEPTRPARPQSPRRSTSRSGTIQWSASGTFSRVNARRARAGGHCADPAHACRCRPRRRGHDLLLAPYFSQYGGFAGPTVTVTRFTLPDPNKPSKSSMSWAALLSARQKNDCSSGASPWNTQWTTVRRCVRKRDRARSTTLACRPRVKPRFSMYRSAS